jgi:hypothetical protein
MRFVIQALICSTLSVGVASSGAAEQLPSHAFVDISIYKSMSMMDRVNYVSGVLDGIFYVTSERDPAMYKKLYACVDDKALGALVDAVDEFARRHVSGNPKALDMDAADVVVGGVNDLCRITSRR